MPPKKRRKIQPPVGGVKPGLRQQYLMDNFSILPPDVKDILKGHVLHCYFYLCNASLTTTAKELMKLFEDSSVDQDDTKRLVNNGVKRAAEAIMKFRRLSDTREMAKFSAVCCENFEVSPVVLPQVLPDETFSGSCELQETAPIPTASVDSLRRNHRDVKRYHKKAQLFSTDTSTEIEGLQSQLHAKDTEIIILQHEKLVLEERVKELEAAIKKK